MVSIFPCDKSILLFDSCCYRAIIIIIIIIIISNYVYVWLCDILRPMAVIAIGSCVCLINFIHFKDFIVCDMGKVKS